MIPDQQDGFNLLDPYLLQYTADNLSITDLYNIMKANYLDRLNCWINVHDISNKVNRLPYLTENIYLNIIGERTIGSVKMFHQAIDEMDSDTILALIQGGFNLIDYMTYTDKMVKLGLEMVKVLVESGVINNYLPNFLTSVVKETDLEILDYLINVGVPYDNNLMFIALETGDENIVNYLVSLGLELNYTNENGYLTLHSAVIGGNLNLVDQIYQLMIDTGPNLEDLENSLYLAIIHNYPHIGDFLIDKGVNIMNVLDLTFDTIYTSIPQAAVKSIPTMEFLLKHGVDINHVYNGEKLTGSAASSGNLEALQFLLDHGANINSSKSILLGAIRNENVEIVEYLLEKGADVNQRDDQGNTPITYAFLRYENPDREYIRKSVRNKFSMIEMLLKYGADLSIINNDGHTIMEVARSYRNHYLTHYLIHQNHGQNPWFPSL